MTNDSANSDHRKKFRNSTAEFLIFTHQKAKNSIEVMYDDDSLWFSAEMLATLFDQEAVIIKAHLQTLYEQAELSKERTTRSFPCKQLDQKQAVALNETYYNLEAVLTLSYRISSRKGIEFRRWATQILSQYAISGYVLDRKRMENGAFLGKNYFEHLLAEIREIRMSNRHFFQKLTDIFATSIDYDLHAPATQALYQEVEDKLHFAIHGNTSAELVANRADASKKHMGLNRWENFPAGKIVDTDIATPRNYLTPTERHSMGLLVCSYLDLAENRAMRRIPMTMQDWSHELDRFLRTIEEEVLPDGERLSLHIATDFALSEFQKYRVVQDGAYRSDFDLMGGW